MLGIYDSGIGGLTIFKEIQDLMPNVVVNYLADTEHLPLGEKKQHEIQEIVQNGVEFLFEKGSNIVILACNTASVNAIRYLQQVWLPQSKWKGRQVLGISKPMLEFVQLQYAHLKNEQGLILSTPATAQTGFYLAEFKNLGFNQIHEISCHGLADAIESENFDQTTKVLKKIFLSSIQNNEIKQLGLTYQALEYLFEQRPERLPSKYQPKTKYVILACTHYSLAIKGHIKYPDQIDYYFPNFVEYINPAKFIAQKVCEYINLHPQYHILNRTRQELTPSRYFQTGNKINVSNQQTKLLNNLNQPYQPLLIQ